jgi:hypothetical protein
MYLGDVEEGGETTLPLGKFIDEGRQRLTNPSESKIRDAQASAPNLILIHGMEVCAMSSSRVQQCMY